MPKLYKSVNAFVLPTRGEGWGFPIIEAMGLPVITTNCTAQLDYFSEEVGFPIQVEAYNSSGWNQGNLAQPSIPNLRKHLRTVFNEREYASKKGLAAHKHVVQNYDAVKVSTIWLEHLQRVEQLIKQNLST